jgi:hypothetical protein
MKASQAKLLLEAEADWRLDEETKAIGLAGVARARAVLAKRDQPDERRPTAA